MPFKSVNPSTGQTIESFESIDDEAIEDALVRADEASVSLRRQTFGERAKKMRQAAEILESEKGQWAELATAEMGKTLASAGAEVEKCAGVCRFYAENAERMLADEPIETEASRSFVRHLPLGPILAVMPWNFPYWQVFRFAAPALMAGNVGLLKHASNVSRCALAIEEIFERAGFEKGAFTTLLAEVDKVEKILADSRVRAATLTGSEGAGKAVASTAGKHLKHVVLELGGSDPFIVMPSANLDEALTAAVKARTINNGQSCIAAKRFIVHSDVYDEFVGRFVERLEALKVGDPMDDDTDIGPLATESIRDELAKQVEDSIARGARRLTGAKPADGPGYFFHPGVLADIPKNSPAYEEELFGPVALVFQVEGLDEALSLANDTRFGLGSAIWTQDDAEAERAIRELEAGSTFVNAVVASDPRLPFGGVKQSGYGRELAVDGIRAFVNRKTVSIA